MPPLALRAGERLPPVLHQHCDEFTNGEAFESSDQVVVSEALDYLIRLSGRLQLTRKRACRFYC
ncbi:hypothetical protein CTS44_26113 [Comamonas thiooxydans]|nr:hypothetical protein CTS44_26113 [Comamonas thiooxydans]